MGGITDTGKRLMLQALLQAINSASVVGTANVEVCGCFVHKLQVHENKIQCIIDVPVQLCTRYGVVDQVTRFISYKLLHDSSVLYEGELNGQTKPTGAGLLIKITLTDGDL